MSADDVDGDALTYSAVIDGNGDISVVDNELTVTPDGNYNGSIAVDVTVSDGQYIDTDSFVLTVNAVNDTPVVEDISTQTDEDVSIDVSLIASDIDGDALTYTIDESSLDGNAILDGDIVMFSPALNFNGSTAFTLSLIHI